ncbi:DUF222 domain-containing protein, partial [Actinomycetospora chlora]|uniref:DUF222 domain-containing protein n=1 Tax=Actinomycetospora chlora TaxID=663608 RepID=UPI0031E61F3F
MSERGVGVVERELLDRARDAEIARRRDHYRRLELVAELDRQGVAACTGDRGVDRLLQVQWNLDKAQVQRLVDEAADLIARRSLQGEPLPPRLPCAAAVAAEGAIGPEHIVVIRRTMARLDRVDGLDPEDWVEAERSLAEQAVLLPPAALTKYAAAVLARLDPDGVAPPEGEDRCDELHVVRRRDGRLDFK